MLNTSFWRKHTYKLLYTCLLILTTTFVFCMVITPTGSPSDLGIQGFYKSNIFSMVSGTAYRPYMYRVLVPFIANKILLNIPEKTNNAIVQITKSSTALKIFFSDRRWFTKYATEYYVVLLLMYTSLWGFVFSFRYLFRGLFKAAERVIDAVTLLAILGLPCLYWTVTYVYDFTTLFLFTLGLAAMVRSKWKLYLFIFILACINKETTILLTCIFAIHFFKHQKLKLSSYIFLLIIQVAIFASIKIFIDMLFIHNKGDIVEFWLKRNITLLLRPYSISLYLQWAALGFLVFYKWSEKPLFLKHGLLILIPLLVSVVFWGWVYELRALYEVYPIVFLLIAYSVAKILDVKIKTQLSSDPSYQWLPVADQYIPQEDNVAVDHPIAEVQN